MNTTAQNIIKTLVYYNIFDYPLTKEEIILFHPLPAAAPEIVTSLEMLCNAGIVFKLEEFFALQDNVLLAGRRKNGNMLAAGQMKIAAKAANILSRFPYVRGIAVSGSLSKNFGTEKSDIDFFIITSPNRLWIARTFMHLYKKITFLTGRQHWFCMNYYVDEASLEIVEKNIFTAMEIVTLISMQGKTSLDNFQKANDWVKNYLPSGNSQVNEVPEIKKGFITTIIEKLSGNKTGNWLDDYLMKITDRRWKKKTLRNKKNDKGIVMGMKVDKHFSKPNPANFQHKVIERFEKDVNQLIQKLELQTV